jgi:hypothetical protein
MLTLPDELLQAAMEELEHTSAFKTLWQSEAIYLGGIRHALGEEYLSGLVNSRQACLERGGG